MASSADAPKSGATQRLLARAHSPSSATRIFADKIQNKPLLLAPTAKTDSEVTQAQNARDARRRRRDAIAAHKRKRPKPLSAKEKRKLGIYDIPAAEKKYDLYLGLHLLWCDYMREILGVPKVPADAAAPELDKHRLVLAAFHVQPGFAGPRLASADFHGAFVTVTRSRCTSYVGLEGIVVKDTKFTFEIITKASQTKTVPKENTVFELKIPLEGSLTAAESTTDIKPLQFELYGSQIANRPADRATRKFKIHIPDDL